MIPQHNIVGLTFHSEGHRYEYNGERYEGITSLINRYIFPDKYKGVSAAVLEQAAQRGHAVHEDICNYYEELRKGVELFPSHNIERFHAMLRPTMLKVIDNEVLVMNTPSKRATAIDLVMQDTEGGIILGDVKTTCEYDDLYLRWQLSIEALMYELCFKIPVVGLVGVWMPNNGEGGIKDVERLPDKEVVRLLCAGAMDVEEFNTEYKPMHNEAMPEVLLEQAELINSLTLQIEELTQEREALLQPLKTALLASSAKSWQGAGIKLVRRSGSTRKTFDTTKFKLEHEDLYSQYIVEKTTVDSVILDIIK